MAPRPRALAALLTATLMLGGCGIGGDGDRGAAIGAASTVSAAAVDSFDLYVLASSENNRLFADVYAITMNPLVTHRLTAGKRVTEMDATRDNVVVAAADGDVDRVGYVGAGGEIVEIAGLGRPPGFQPRVEDGQILFSDFVLTGPKKTKVYRYFSYDPKTQKRTTLLRSTTGLFGPIPLPGRFHGFVTADEQAPRLEVKDAKRTVRSFPLSPLTSALVVGKRWMALQLVADGPGFDRPSLGLDLLDPSTGEKRHVEGWQPITWSPDGTKLLVRRAGVTTDSELALLDPDRPTTAPEPLGTIPNLTIYTGAWVARS